MSHAPASSRSSALAPTRRFFRSPKGRLILVLGALTLVAGVNSGLRATAPGLIAALLSGMAVDLPLLRLRKHKWAFPDGALLTGWIIALILSPQTPWHVAAIASAVGVASKYLLRSRTANIFNPAALALLAAYALFRSGQSWWGALPELTPPGLEPVALAVLIATGLVIAGRVNRVPAALSFLGIHYLLFSVAAFVSEPAGVAAIFRSSDLHAALFCAFFMVTDPPTSPPRDRDQIIFGAVAASASFTVFELTGAVYFLLAGLLVANAGEAWRRIRVHARPRHA